jgi:hypothetical protein
MANRAKRGVYQLILLTEDAIGNLAEMGSRFESGQWPTPATRKRVMRRIDETVPTLQRLRRELQIAQDCDDDNRPPPAASGRVRARRAA